MKGLKKDLENVYLLQAKLNIARVLVIIGFFVKIIGFILLLPIKPLLIALKRKDTDPMQAKVLTWLWCIFLFFFVLLVFLVKYT